MEIWHSREGISAYKTIEDLLAAIDGFRKTGAKLNATYVYDKETGLKLFGKTAFYVLTDSGFETFLRKPDADAFAAAAKGKVMDYEAALATLGS
jgi:NitT/TauT family transport system substrate-binding protein